jgi:hypothetical protein
LGVGHSAWGNDTTEILVSSAITPAGEGVAVFHGYRAPEMGDMEN